MANGEWPSGLRYLASASTIRGWCGGDGDEGVTDMAKKKPVTGVCECFGDSKVTEVQDRMSVFEGLRASEAKA